MFSTPLTCCSSGATTVAATTSALAPGYCPVTLTTGGAISGYWATGSRPMDTAPRMTKTIETTAAKIGRSMKKWDWGIRGSRSMGVDLRAAARRGGGTRLLRRYLSTWARAHQAVDDDVVIGRQTLGDDAQAIDDRSKRHVLRPGDILGVNHQHKLAHLLDPDGSVGHEQCVLGRCSRHPNPREHAGREPSFRVGEDGARTDGARGAIDCVVDEIHPPLGRKRGLIDNLALERRGQPSVGLFSVGFGELPLAHARVPT